MSTTPTLRDAARQARDALGVAESLLAQDKSYHHPKVLKAYNDLDAALDALTQGAGAVEPVAYAHQAMLDWLADPARGKSAHTATELHKSGNGFAQVALYAAPPAQQLQQAVAREREECAAMAEGAFFGNPGEIGWEIAAAIRAKGTHD